MNVILTQLLAILNAVRFDLTVKRETIEALVAIARNPAVPRATRYGCRAAAWSLYVRVGEHLSDSDSAYVLGILDVARDALAHEAGDCSALPLEALGFPPHAPIV